VITHIEKNPSLNQEIFLMVDIRNTSNQFLKLKLKCHLLRRALIFIALLLLVVPINLLDLLWTLNVPFISIGKRGQDHKQASININPQLIDDDLDMK
jgi:hypothetical protein